MLTYFKTVQLLLLLVSSQYKHFARGVQLVGTMDTVSKMHQALMPEGRAHNIRYRYINDWK